MKRPTLEATSKALKPTGNHLSILLLIVPIISIVLMVTKTEVVFPIDQKEFLLKGFSFTLVSFFIMATLSFYNTKKDRAFFAVIGFLFLLWNITGIYLVGYLNYKFDFAPKQIQISTITSFSIVSNKRSKSYCLAYLDSNAHIRELRIPTQYCQNPKEQERIEYHLHPGALTLSWYDNLRVLR